MSSDQEKWISIMIVPEDGAGMRKWRVTTRRYSFFKAGFWLMSLFLLVGFVSMVLLGVMYGKVRRYRAFNQQLLEATSKLELVVERLDRYEGKERKLRSIIGSDIELPDVVAVATVPGLTTPGASGAAGSLDELQQAIATEEARVRRLPTMWPVDAWQVSKQFQNTGNPRTSHLGIDILAPKKSGVVASADGVVRVAGFDDEYGHYMIIDHENGWETRYGHNESLLLKSGSIVQKGHLIAVYGGTGGTSTGAHLHFGMFYKGQPVNPLVWLEKKPLVNLAENK